MTNKEFMSSIYFHKTCQEKDNPNEKMSRKWEKITRKRENLNNNKCNQKDKQLSTSEKQKQKPTIRWHSPPKEWLKLN